MWVLFFHFQSVECNFLIHLFLPVLLQVSIFNLLTFSLLPLILTPSFPLCVDYNTYFVSFLSSLLSLDSLLSLAFIFKLFALIGNTDFSFLPAASFAGNRSLWTGYIYYFQHKVWIFVISSLIFSNKVFYWLYSLHSKIIRSWIFRTAVLYIS